MSSAMMVDLMLPSASISKVMSVRHPERMNASRPMPMARKHRCMSTREGVPSLLSLQGEADSGIHRTDTALMFASIQCSNASAFNAHISL